MRLSRIDDLTRREHYFIGDQDTCFYLGEYSARKGGVYGMTSVLVHDLLHPRDPAVVKQEHRKDRALGSVAQWLHEVFDPGNMGTVTFVPMPQSGSGVITDDDERMFRILKRAARGLDIRKLIEVTGTNRNNEHGNLRSGPNVLYENMRVASALIEPRPRVIFLVDDVLATGANFVAAKRRLLQLLPEVPVFGLFIARKSLDSGEILGR